MLKKSIPIPINKDSTPVFHVYLVSLAIIIIPHFKRKDNRKTKNSQKNREFFVYKITYYLFVNCEDGGEAAKTTECCF